MTSGRTVHVIGAGLAGLSAAVALTRQGARVIVHEAAPRAGGRCRSYYDRTLGQTIDNGNHFVFSGNQAVRRYLQVLGTADRLEGPSHADFAFHDLRDGSRWTLAVNDSPLPWWVLDPRRRTPGTSLGEHMALARLALSRPGSATIADRVDSHGTFWDRVVDPMMLAVLNCPPAEGSAWLAGRFLRESFARGGRACRTMVAVPNLDAVFIDPALTWLNTRNVQVRFGARLRGLVMEGDHVTALDFGAGEEALGGATVVLAVPPWVAGELIRELVVPDRFCSILNAHFACAPPPGARTITALIGGTAQWVVCHPDRISITISGADDVIDEDREALAARIWKDIVPMLGLDTPMPTWQIVKERRATFAATPMQDARRPSTRTRWRNLFLAGDWTQTGLPATIEGALRSGEAAARLAVAS
ncbi:hydroxysqualene dehydroxylase HpnE [Novosphingobium sp.]|uniref:hydroxysqualene dehydroxylase HpnE n=1 Tax=Novosphingobium sp. TaxID=1874826 RepID=UPI001D42B452|nr:hydroxysqualene dehydroxylase HpnE [Novosphingobium sp.]MBX9664745.1 hydroxysqualene dehydroxylase HpnE [Novosphingobium sp.]